MKHLLRLVCTLLLSGGLAAAPSAPATGFDQLKSLVGDWEGAALRSGIAVRVSYELVSDGTALLERHRPSGEPEMISVYTADGQRVALTHYCSANNQPQLRTEPISGPAEQLTFAFVRATNLADSKAGRMDRLVVTFEDENHFTQEWTWLDKGQTKKEVFDLHRKK